MQLESNTQRWRVASYFSNADTGTIPATVVLVLTKTVFLSCQNELEREEADGAENCGTAVREC